MQNPSTSATVGKGRAASRLKVSQPRRTIPSASSTLSICVNSSTSAPAMNPDALPERITRPFGRSVASRSTIRPSSAITSCEKVLVDSPALSNVSQTIPSASRSGRQWR